MLRTPGVLLLVVFALLITIMNLTAQDDGCYIARAVTPMKRSIVRHSLTKMVGVSHVHFGSTYAVLRSRRHEGECWIETNKGWIRATQVIPARFPTAMPTFTPVPTPTMTPTPRPSCFSKRRAYVDGHMNVRSSHTINSAVVSTAKRGDIFEVSESVRGQTYCWLNIGEGWMAQTSIVYGSMPVSVLPRIEGNKAFKKQIIAAFNFLWEKSIDWFWYVVDNSAVIIRSTRTREGSGRSTAEGWLQRIGIHREHQYPMILLASVLVHEACHIIQWKRGDRPGWFDTDGAIRKEKECFRIQRRMVREIYPFHSLVDELTSILHQSYLDWLLYVW